MRPWLLPLLLTAACSEAGECLQDEGCDPEDPGHLNLLQRAGRQLFGSKVEVGQDANASEESHEVKEAFTLSQGRSTGIAFCGGGFRAHAVGIGWLAGMMAATKKPMHEILNVKAIASNSGGSWFTGSLLYSNRFNAMIQAMSAEPQKAGHIFQMQWGNHWKQIAKSDKTDIPEQVACCSPKGMLSCGLGIYNLPNTIDLDGSKFCCPEEVVPEGCKVKGTFSCGTWNVMSKGYGLPEEVTFGRTNYCCPRGADSKQFDEGQGCVSLTVKKNLLRGVRDLGRTLAWFVFDSKVDYDDIIGQLLEIPGDMKASDPISSSPVEWARGKDYLVAQSFMTPPGDGVAMSYQGSFGKMVTSKVASDSKKELQTWHCAGSLCGSQVPARFSTTLGAARSPLPITSDAATSTLHMKYQRQERRLGLLWYHTVEEAESSHELKNWHSSHQVPIKYAVGGSSALLGSLNVFTPSIIPSSLQHLIPSWILYRFTAGEIPFLAEADALDYATFQQAKQMLKVKDFNLPALARSHLIEVTDAGQIDNTAVGHLIAAGHTNVVSIYNTAGFSPEKHDVMKSFHQMLSGYPSTVSGASGYTIFQQDMHEVARQLRSFDKAPAVAGASVLAAIWAGELHLSTVGAPSYGIRPGQSVTVRMVIVDGRSISCCGVDIDEYAIFMREIIQTLAANKAFATKILKWF